LHLGWPDSPAPLFTGHGIAFSQRSTLVAQESRSKPRDFALRPRDVRPGFTHQAIRASTRTRERACTDRHKPRKNYGAARKV